MLRPSITTIRAAAHILTALLALVGALAFAPPALAQGQTLPDERYDLTGNGRVDYNDAASARDSWGSLQSEGPCLAPGDSDLDGNGCLDVADVQRVAAQVGLGPQLAQAPGLAQAEAVHVVNSDGNDNDASRGDGECRTSAGACTLRAALQEANARPGPDRIEFNIREPGGACPALVTIRPGRDAPEFFLLEDDGTTIDGYTQCGARPNSGAVAGDAVIKIQLDGGVGSSNYPARNDVDGITIRSSNNLIRGLAIFRWDHQILITGSRANYNRIQGNFLGTSADNQFRMTTGSTHHNEGIRLWYNARYNVIGCGEFSGEQFQPCTSSSEAYAARNIISGNGNDGIHFEGNPTTGSPEFNRIVGNYIGLKQDGATALPNRSDAVDFEAGAANNWLGGESALERNVISGNGSEGIEISHSRRTQGNRVVGNYFGLDASGTKIVANTGNGISFEDTVRFNYAYWNHTGGNYGGFRFYVLAEHNQVYENVIGLMADGVTPAPNRHDGVYVMGGSQHNLIARNTIAHNKAKGIDVDPLSDVDNGWMGETYFNTISENSIYNNAEKGINLNSKEMGGRLLYGNQNLASPRIVAASATLAVGTSGCAGCRVELFIADKNTVLGDERSGEGKTFIGAGETGADGQFAVALAGAVAGDVVTATITDTFGNTSEFARNVRVGTAAVEALPPAPTFTPAPSPTPTLSPTPEGGAPEPTATPTATATTGPGTGEAPDRPFKIWLPMSIR